MGRSHGQRLVDATRTRAVADLDALLHRARPDWLLVDWFDTVVHRTVHRRDVAHLAARHLVRATGLGIGADAVLDARRRAEADLAERVGEDEYSLIDVAEAVAAEVCEPEVGAIDGFVQAMVDVEVHTELSVQRLHTDLADVLRRAPEGTRLAVVSDFHLPAGRFADMARHHGVFGLFDDIVVSCDLGSSKRSGRLYEPVLTRLGVDVDDPAARRRVVMVGDQEVADAAMARRAGLTAHLVPSDRDRIPPATSQRPGRRLATEVDRIVSSAAGPFPEMALTLFEFTHRLHRGLVAEGATSVGFLAREGQLLRDLFDRYQAALPPGHPTVRSEYVYVSRRATHLPALGPLAEETFEGLLDRYDGIATADFLASLGFDDDERQAWADPTAPADAGDATPVDVDRLRADPTFAEAYEQRRTAQRDLLRRHVEALDLVGGDGRVHVVDVGWAGSIQDQLALALERPVVGWYVGLVDDRPVLDADAKRGVLFDGTDGHSPFFHVFGHFKSLFEFTLVADHGSVAGYRDHGGSVLPVLDHQDVEAAVFESLIAPFRVGLIDVFDQLVRTHATVVGDVDDRLRFVARHHGRMLWFPTRAETDLVERIRHYENFGAMTMVGVDDDRAGRSRRRLAVDLARDPRQLLGGSWGPLLLRRAGLGALVPALGGYRLAREFHLRPRMGD